MARPARYVNTHVNIAGAGRPEGRRRRRPTSGRFTRSCEWLNPRHRRPQRPVPVTVAVAAARLARPHVARRAAALQDEAPPNLRRDAVSRARAGLFAVANPTATAVINSCRRPKAIGSAGGRARAPPVPSPRRKSRSHKRLTCRCARGYRRNLSINYAPRSESAQTRPSSHRTGAEPRPIRPPSAIAPPPRPAAIPAPSAAAPKPKGAVGGCVKRDCSAVPQRSRALLDCTIRRDDTGPGGDRTASHR